MRRYLILSASVLALAACGKKEETITIKTEDGSTATAVASSDGATSTTTIKTAEGEMKIAAGGSATFPAFAPQYPGSTISSTMTASGDANNGGGSMIGLETRDTPAQVMAFYKQKLVDANMPVKMETTTPQGGMLAAGEEGENRGVLITVGMQGDKTSIAIISGQGK